MQFHQSFGNKFSPAEMLGLLVMHLVDQAQHLKQDLLLDSWQVHPLLCRQHLFSRHKYRTMLNHASRKTFSDRLSIPEIPEVLALSTIPALTFSNPDVIALCKCSSDLPIISMVLPLGGYCFSPNCCLASSNPASPLCFVRLRAS